MPQMIAQQEWHMTQREKGFLIDWTLNLTQSEDIQA